VTIIIVLLALILLAILFPSGFRVVLAGLMLAVGILLIAAIAISVAHADSPYVQYGIGHMKCAEISKVFGNSKQGEIYVEFYVGGFLTGINKTASATDENGSDEKDIANKADVEDIAYSVFRYCKAHPRADGTDAITEKIEKILEKKNSD